MKAFVACALLTVSLLAGCEKTIPLEQRVKAYWDARKARDFAAAYELEQPNSAIDEATYLKKMERGNVGFILVKIDNVRAEEKQATVDLKITYKVVGFARNLESKMADPWLRVDRQWYHKMPFSEEAKAPLAAPGNQPAATSQ